MKRSLAAFAATLVCVSALTTTPASADTTKPNDTNPACALSLDDGALTCVDNEENLYSAVYTQTGDIVAPVNSATPSLLKAASTSVVVAQFWDDTSYSGSTFMMYRSKGCSSSSAPGGATDFGSSWHNRVSSMRGYSGCLVKVWSGTGYTGSSYGYVGTASSLGSMNNKAKSAKVAD